MGKKCRRTYYRIIPIIIFFLIALKTAAQDSIMPVHLVTVGMDNDFLNIADKGTDEYYTAGIYLQYGFASNSPKNILRKILPLPSSKSSSFFSIGLTQWMFTPSDLKTTNYAKDDYPYCGSLFLGLSRENIVKQKNLFRSEIWLGIMGKSALGEQTQMLVHKIMGFEKPEGWNEQLPDYPLINYNLYYERSLLPANDIVKVNGFAYLQTGSLLNTLSAGIDFMITNKKENNFPDRYYITTGNENMHDLKFFIQLKPTIRVVASNAMLEGGFFQEKNYYHIQASDLNRIIGLLEGNMGIHARRFSLICKQVLETPQFKMVHGHVYGSIILSMNM